jgi:hypothetical protein
LRVGFAGQDMLLSVGTARLAWLSRTALPRETEGEDGRAMATCARADEVGSTHQRRDEKACKSGGEPDARDPFCGFIALFYGG